MQLTSLSPDYTRPLFDTGLDDEENFKNYHVNFSWQRQDVAMTPLFLATQRSSQGSYSFTQGTSMRNGVLRGTQRELEFTQTQANANDATFNWMNPSVQVTAESFTNQTRERNTSLLGETSFMDDNAHSLFNETDSSASQRAQDILLLKNKFSRQEKSPQVGYFYASKEVGKKKMREATRERQKAARDKKVVMYRKYRVGELPDIQIKYSELIVALQALAQRDRDIAQQLFSSVISSVVNILPELHSDDVVANLNSDIQQGLDVMLKTSTLYNSSFISAVQNVLYKSQSAFTVDPQTVSRVSILSMQQTLGALLIESQLLSSSRDGGPNPSKRRRGRDGAAVNESIASWMELAKMYESIKDFDFLRSIFSSKVSVDSMTRDALSFEARNDYESALALYRKASAADDFENTPTEEEEDYWDSARLRCYEKLGMWCNLKDFTVKSIEQVLDGDDGKPVEMSRIWEDDLLQETYLPCYIKSNMKLLCQGNVDQVHEGFMTFIEESLKEEMSKIYLQTHFCDELALLNIFKDSYGASTHYVNISIQNFLDDWSHTNKLINAGRRHQLDRLQKIVELEEFATFMNGEGHKHEDKVKDLISVWSERSLDKKVHGTSVWDDIMLNRSAYIRKIKSHFAPNSVLSTFLDTTEMKFILAVADVARKQGNFAVAQQYLRDSSHITTQEEGDPLLSLQWHHTYLKILNDKVTKDKKKNACAGVQALLRAKKKHLDQCLLDVIFDKSKVVKHKLLEYDVLTLIASNVKHCSSDGFDSLKDGICQLLGNHGSQQQQSTVRQIEERAFDILEEGLTISKSLYEENPAQRKSYVKTIEKFADFCDEQVKKEDEGSESYAGLLVSNLLKAMQLNSVKARVKFPRLLQIIEAYPDARDNFKLMTQEIPCWMFLGWLNQILALMDKPLQTCLTGIVDVLAQAYPQSLMYSLRVSSEQYQFKKDRDGMNRKMYVERLMNLVVSPLLEPFALALGQLTNPCHILKDFLDQMLEHVENKDRKRVEICYRDFSRSLLQDSAKRRSSSVSCDLPLGACAKKFKQKHGSDMEKDFGKDGKKLIGMTTEDYKKLKVKWSKVVKEGERCEGSLKQFSPWLSDFQADHFHSHLEIPGQYDGKSKPLVEYHVKIAGFDEKLLTLQSLRKPKRLVIHGDDEKEYKFLVKGGEDLRLDQRIEQIFELMNVILKNDPICSNRSLALELKTYKVVPLTPRVGIIEWVDNSEPYKEMLDNVMTEKERKATHGQAGGRNLFLSWVSKYGCKVHYDNLYKAASLSDTRKAFEDAVATVPWDLLRRVFNRMAATSDAYFILRSHFVQSHACMCIAQYLLGIGDRHRANMLIDKRSGGVVGIDFGYAFGGATQLPVPELMPFRLTQQMLNLLLPLADALPYKQVMVVVLQAFHKQASILLNTMDVFINEPLLDWQIAAKKQTKEMEASQESPENTTTWYPRQKIRLCEKKLAGVNPAYITGEELRMSHGSKPIHQQYIAVAQGTAKYNIRKRLLDTTSQPEEHFLSVEEQVDCLIDQATDPGILGRTWVGWDAWM